MLNPISPIPISWWGSQTGDPEPPVGGGSVVRWLHSMIRRQVWVRPVRLNPTPIIEPGQTEDPT